MEKAKQQLLELSNEKQQSSFSAEVRAKPQHHKFLIGKNGANIKKVANIWSKVIANPRQRLRYFLFSISTDQRINRSENYFPNGRRRGKRSDHDYRKAEGG